MFKYPFFNNNFLFSLTLKWPCFVPLVGFLRTYHMLKVCSSSKTALREQFRESLKLLLAQSNTAVLVILPLKLSILLLQNIFVTPSIHWKTGLPYMYILGPYFMLEPLLHGPMVSSLWWRYPPGASWEIYLHGRYIFGDHACSNMYLLTFHIWIMVWLDF